MTLHAIALVLLKTVALGICLGGFIAMMLSVV
jgi:hypothetical protein